MPGHTEQTEAVSSPQPPKKWAIRPVRESDFKEILSIDHVIFPHLPQWNESTLRRYWDSQYSQLACEEGTGKIVGYIFMKKERDGSFYIGNFGTHQDYQRQNVGNQLMGAALACARHSATPEREVRFVLEVDTDNPAAIRLYEKHGFKPAGPGSQAGYQRMEAKQRGLKSGLRNAPSQSTSVATTSKTALVHIVDTLLLNVSTRAGGRQVSSKYRALLDVKAVIERQTSDVCESAAFKQSQIAALRRICAIQRNPFHFWKTPHSVVELNGLLRRDPRFNDARLREEVASAKVIG